jgi:hypothetical protein
MRRSRHTRWAALPAALLLAVGLDGTSAAAPPAGQSVQPCDELPGENAPAQPALEPTLLGQTDAAAYWQVLDGQGRRGNGARAAVPGPLPDPRNCEYPGEAGGPPAPEGAVTTRLGTAGDFTNWKVGVKVVPDSGSVYVCKR